jgi:hypothetical protein
LRGLLTEPGEDGLPQANKVHIICGGMLPGPASDASPEGSLSNLARDAYPAFLVPPDEPPMAIPFGPLESHRASLVIHRHPGAKAFESAILADSVFRNIFGKDDPHSGRTSQIFRSRFRGGGLQLSMLAHIILTNAWRQTPAATNPRPSRTSAKLVPPRVNPTANSRGMKFRSFVVVMNSAKYVVRMRLGPEDNSWPLNVANIRYS